MNKKLYAVFLNVTRTLTRRGALRLVGLFLATAGLIAGTLSVTGFGTKYYRLGGGFVGGSSAYTWSVMFAPSDPLGQSAAARTILKYFNSQFSGLLASFGAENVSDATGEVKMISADTARWTLVSYMQVAPKQPGDALQNKAIIVAHGTWKFTSNDTVVLDYVRLSPFR